MMITSTVIAQTPTRLGMLVLGYDLDNLPERPSIEQQIKAGEHQLSILKQDESSFDSKTELVDYLNSIVEKLVETSPRVPPYRIHVHLSSLPIVNAQSLPGGQIVIEERMFDRTDTESQLVAFLVHETEHELHNDFLKMWRDFKRKQAGLVVHELADAVENETAADLAGARLMYDAGWDPQGMVEIYRRSRLAVSLSHPPNDIRIKTLQEFIARLPAKSNLISDSARFRDLKARN